MPLFVLQPRMIPTYVSCPFCRQNRKSHLDFSQNRYLLESRRTFRWQFADFSNGERTSPNAFKTLPPKGLKIMTTPSSESVRKVAKPESVLGQISNAESTPITSEMDGVSESFPRLRVVHGDSETYEDQLDQPLELPQQRP